MQDTSPEPPISLPTLEKSPNSVNLKSEFRIGQRVHTVGDSCRIGTVKYLGPVQGYSGTWVGVDWDNADGKHDGSINDVRYFQANGEKSGSCVRCHNLTAGISLLDALELRYRATSTKEAEDEMYVFSARNKRVSIQLLGGERIQDKMSRLEELTGASLSFLGVNSYGSLSQSSPVLSNVKELDLTGNLLSEWKDVGVICEQLPALVALNLSYNVLAHDITGLPLLPNICVLVLNNTGINWTQVEILKNSVPAIKELHLMGNKIKEIQLASSSTFQGFDSLQFLNLEDNCIADWNEILKISQLKSLEQLHLNKNRLTRIFYPDDNTMPDLLNGNESLEKCCRPFHKLHCLLLGGNNIEDLASVDALNYFPKLKDVRLSENPITDPISGGIARFALIARLENVEILNGSEIRPRERKDSEIRYVRLIISQLHESEEIRKLHPRFTELKNFHGIEDERPSNRTAGPQKMASGLISITLKCIGPSIGEKPQLMKKLPATTTVGKLKILCQSFFKLKSIRPRLFFQEEGAPLPILLDDEMASLIDVGICNGSTILIDEEN